MSKKSNIQKMPLTMSKPTNDDHWVFGALDQFKRGVLEDTEDYWKRRMAWLSAFYICSLVALFAMKIL